jgi:MFS transporter, Spinster family, sphingosine-1-phosphate transporter
MPNPVSDDARRNAAFALAVLSFINLFNYLDRWMLPAVLESVKKDLHFTDAELGTIAVSFVIVYTLTSPIFGSLGDTKKRPPLIALGVAIWSVATAMGGIARGYVSLFTARATVGVGEAAYATIAPALLSDHFPLEKRGRVFAIFFAAIPLGSALSYVLGGLLNQHFGWRAAFFIAGVPGLLFAVLTMFVKEAPRGQYDPPEQREEHARPPLRAYLHLAKNTQYVLACLGYAAYTFALGGLAVWTPAFLMRERGLSASQATVTFGAIVLATGFAGTVIGGWLGDALLKYTKESYLWVCGVSALLAAPFAYIAFTQTNRTVYTTAMVIAEIFVFASTGPINSAIVNLVAPTERASAVALSIFLMHILGDVPSPPLIGWLSDAHGLAKAFLIVPFAILITGAIWTWAAIRGARTA